MLTGFSRGADKGRDLQVEILIPLILLTAFLGQIYFNPFSEHFRFSLSVPALSLLLLYFPRVSPMICSGVAGITMVVFRTVIFALSNGADQVVPALTRHMTSLVFYLVFGLVFTLMKLQSRRGNTLLLFLCLWVCETLANLAEIFMVRASLTLPMETAIFFIILVGGVRSGCTVSVYWISHHFLTRYERQQKEERYTKMLLFFSSVKTDLLFFGKSAWDIEDAMKRSYALYEQLEDAQLREQALSVARHIHDIKKDYQRIAASIDRALAEEYEAAPMRLSEIFRVLQQSTRQLLQQAGSGTTVVFICKDDLLVEQYYMLISILNNLVVNAMESIADAGQPGRIQVTCQRENGQYVFSVQDDGPGVDRELLEYIFEPGFTTKFDPQTGEMSNGLGLVHVRHVVERYYRGSIFIESRAGSTTFTVSIPMERMTGGTVS